MPPALSSVQKKVQGFVEDILKKLPKLNNRTGERKQCSKQGEQQQLADFIYPFPNPTVSRSNEAVNISKLEPADFELLGSKVVLLGPDIFWPNLVKIRCPLCSDVAAPHGWCKSYRRVKGLYNTYFLVGRRYKCVGCKGEPGVTQTEVCKSSAGVTCFAGTQANLLACSLLCMDVLLALQTS